MGKKELPETRNEEITAFGIDIKPLGVVHHVHVNIPDHSSMQL